MRKAAIKTASLHREKSSQKDDPYRPAEGEHGLNGEEEADMLKRENSTDKVMTLTVQQKE